MIQATDILAQLNHRYVVVGSTAIRLHGFAWDQPQDLDVWLDPTMGVSEWDAVVDSVSKSLDRIWTRGHDNGRGGIHHSTRLICQPKLDFIHQIGDFQPSGFDSVFDRSLISELGNVAPIDVVLRMKRQANRGKDFRHFLKLVQLISNP
jgi:hypothetical protein